MNFNTKYWKEFYKNKERDKESPFARFCMGFIEKHRTFVDFGCGDGRDTYYIGQQNFVNGIDNATKNEDTSSVKFIKEDISKYIDKYKPFQITYCRFLFHAIPEKLMWKILDWSNIVMAEFRVKGDVPKIYTDHKRREIDPYKLKEDLIKKGFTIDYFKVGRGMAKYKGEDPLICRLICKK